MWACFIFLLYMLMTSANISLKKKIFHWVENVIKQLVHTSAVHSWRYEALGKFGEHSRGLHIFPALQISCVLCILMNTHWRINQLLTLVYLLDSQKVTGNFLWWLPQTYIDLNYCCCLVLLVANQFLSCLVINIIF